MKQKIFALANMINRGKKFAVVSVPDYNGGHYYKAVPSDYELKPFEYFEWEGTPKKAAEENPVFMAHIEPLHEKAEDYEMTLLQILEYTLR